MLPLEQELIVIKKLININLSKIKLQANLKDTDQFRIKWRNKKTLFDFSTKCCFLLPVADAVEGILDYVTF